MKLCKDRSQRGGFTLVEVVVASFIMVLVLMVLLTSLVMGRFSASMAKHRSQAINLIQQKVEQLKSQGYVTLHAASQASPVTTENSLVLDGNVDSRNDLLCARQATLNDNCGYDDAVEITVEVSWSERNFSGNVNVTEEMSTLMVDAGN